MLWLIKCQNNLPGDLEEPGDRKTLTTKPPRTDHIWLAESRDTSFHQGGLPTPSERGWLFLGLTAPWLAWRPLVFKNFLFSFEGKEMLWAKGQWGNG